MNSCQIAYAYCSSCHNGDIFHTVAYCITLKTYSKVKHQKNLHFTLFCLLRRAVSLRLLSFYVCVLYLLICLLIAVCLYLSAYCYCYLLSDYLVSGYSVSDYSVSDYSVIAVGSSHEYRCYLQCYLRCYLMFIKQYRAKLKSY